jgi:hypothetical protein
LLLLLLLLRLLIALVFLLYVLSLLRVVAGLPLCWPSDFTPLLVKGDTLDGLKRIVEVVILVWLVQG